MASTDKLALKITVTFANSDGCVFYAHDVRIRAVDGKIGDTRPVATSVISLDMDDKRSIHIPTENVLWYYVEVVKS